jgi:coatomer subunit beta
MLIMTSIIRVGQSQFATAPIDEDSVERILTCLHSLSASSSPAEVEPVRQVFLHDTQAAYTGMVAHGEQKAAEKKAKESKSTAIQADDLITFRQFAKKAGGDADEVRARLSTF